MEHKLVVQDEIGRAKRWSCRCVWISLETPARWPASPPYGGQTLAAQSQRARRAGQGAKPSATASEQFAPGAKRRRHHAAQRRHTAKRRTARRPHKAVGRGNRSRGARPGCGVTGIHSRNLPFGRAAPQSSSEHLEPSASRHLPRLFPSRWCACARSGASCATSGASERRLTNPLDVPAQQQVGKAPLPAP